MKIIIIAAVDKVGAIGYKNQLLFHLSADLKRFKNLTTGNTIIMGRRTFESLPHGALPNRRNIVLSTKSFSCVNAEVYSSLQEALQKCETEKLVFIIGGASVYRQVMSIADRLELTEVQATALKADVYFPLIDRKQWKEVKRVSSFLDDKNAMAYDFVTYDRI